MNENEIRSEIEALTSSNKYRQYPASKTQMAKLDELNLTALMPQRFLGGGRYGVGYQDAEIVLQAAQDAGGTVGGWTAYGDGDVTRTAPSRLYQLLNEPEPEPEQTTSSVAETDDPNGEYDPADIDPADEALDRLIDEVAETELHRFEAEAAREEEAAIRRSAQLDELHPLSYFADIAKPATLRRAALEGRLVAVAEKIGRDWFTSERDVLAFLKRCEFRSKIATIPVVRLIPFEDAQRRNDAGLPVAWYRQWSEEYPSGATIWYSQVNINVPDVIRPGWKPLAFPTRERLGGWEVYKTAPKPHVRGWWFGIPDPQWLREQRG